jgi:nitroimidazol reductase NimA-like FMN-containing flavoprotein (pyridoxamine 5'-phosphate oxidase superfamily)
VTRKDRKKTTGDGAARRCPRPVRGAHYAHIATLLPDGGPHSVPVWAGIEDGKIAFLTPPGSRKARNLAADPRRRSRLPTATSPTRWRWYAAGS